MLLTNSHEPKCPVNKKKTGIFLKNSSPARVLSKATLASLLISSGAGAIEANPIKQNEWYAIRYGDVVSCHTLSTDPSGAYIMERYLLALPEAMNRHGAVLEFFDKNALAELNQDMRHSLGYIPGSSLYSDAVPFYFERYRLDKQYNILKGKVVKGAFSLAQNGLHLEGNPAEMCRMADTVLEPYSQHGLCTSFKSTGVDIEKGLEVSGPGGSIFSGDGCTEKLDVPSGTTPLVLVAHGASKNFQNVYEPLHRLNGSTSFSIDDLNHYYNTNAVYSLALSGGTSAIVAASLVAGAITGAKALALLGAGLSAGGIVAGAYLLTDYFLNTPQDRAQTRKSKLDSERATVTSDLSKTQLKKDATSVILAERYGIKGTPEQLQAVLQDFSQKTSEHYVNTLTERNELERLKKQLVEAEQQLVDIEGKNKRIQELDIQLQNLSVKISEVERTLPPSPSSSSSLPYPETDRMPQPNNHYLYAPPSIAVFNAEGIRRIHIQLEQLNHEWKGLSAERERLVRDSLEAAALNEQVRAQSRDIKQQILVIKESLDNKEAVYEREVGEPKRLLENHFAALSGFENLQGRRENLDRRIESANLHKELMALIAQFKEYQRRPRDRVML